MNFLTGVSRFAASNYRRLPKPEGYTFQNRFVGDYLIYGTGSGWGIESRESQICSSYAGPEEIRIN